MDASLLTPSRFIKSQEFRGKDYTLTISAIKIEALEGTGGTKDKGIVYFQETKKGWVLNRTNIECLKAMWGRETDEWLGKRVTLFPAPFTDSITGEETTAIRVRGSPDIEKTISATIALPRKRPVQVTLTKTGAAPRAKPGPKPKADAANAKTERTDGAPPDAPWQADDAGMSASDRREAAREKANGGRGTVEEQLANGHQVVIEDATGGDPFSEPGAQGD